MPDTKVVKNVAVSNANGFDLVTASSESSNVLAPVKCDFRGVVLTFAV
jgi:hypothetical protein